MVSSRKVDVVFPLAGRRIPLDHRYLLFSALHRPLPVIHDNPDIGVFPIRGVRVRAGLALQRESTLRIRLPNELLGAAVRLAGHRLEIGNYPVRLGVSSVYPIEHHARLRSDMVMIRLSSQVAGSPVDPAQFCNTATCQLRRIASSGTLSMQPSSRQMRIRGRNLVGFPVEIENLSEEDSLIVMEHGIGGKRSMGCGLFYPTSYN